MATTVRSRTSETPAGLVAAACSSGGGSHKQTQSGAENRQAPPTAAPAAKTDPVAFGQDMRKLWEEHVTWTRLYIVSATSGLPDAQPTLDRLLRTHISQAGDLVKAAKANDQAAVAKAKDAWYANADDIATFLSQANPSNWPVDEVKAMMHTHLDQTIGEATDRLKGNHTQEIADYDAIEDHILKLADTLSAGIIKQYPDKFKA